MPKTKRDLLKRQMAHAYNNIKRAIGHLSNVETEFHNVHPELAEGLQVAMVALNDFLSLLDHFAAEAWGRDSINWEAHANVPERTKEISQKQLDPEYDPYNHSLDK